MKKQIFLKNDEYFYSIRKSTKAKHIRLQITRDRGIELIIPKKESIQKGVLFVESKRSWLEKRLKLIGQFDNKFRYFGEEITLNLEYHLFIDRLTYTFQDKKLSVIIPSETQVTEEEIYYEWLYRKANQYIPERVKNLAEQNNFNYNSVRVKRLKSRWGSCSSIGNLSFNYKLLHFNSKVIDYVIIHELCHLNEMNHSKRFWNLVGSIIPDYEVLKKQLNN